MFEAEKLWEKAMIDHGVERYLRACDRAKVRVDREGKKHVAKDEAATSYGIAIMREVFQPYEDCVRWVLEDRMSGKGRPNMSMAYIAACDIREVCYIAAKCIIDSISRVESQTSLAMRISGHMEDQMRMNSFDKTHPKYYRAIEAMIAKRQIVDYRRKRKLLVHCHNKAAEPQWEVWPYDARLTIGVAMIDMFIMATSSYKDDGNNCYQPELRIRESGFVERITSYRKGSAMYMIAGTDRAAEWIKANMAACMELQPEFLPTMIRPKDWTTPTDGGYHLPELRRRKPLVKSHKKHLQILRNAFMPDVYEAVNAAQGTAWQVNRWVWDIALAEFNAPHGIGFPGQEPITPPECPLEAWEQGDMTDAEFRAYRKAVKQQLTIEEKEDYAEWATVAQDCYNRENERKSKIINMAGTMRVAKLLADHDHFYYVHTLDYRSRLYPCGTGLNPQGTDLSKALLRFHVGTALAKTGFWHMAIHAAGVYGVDKVSIEERVQWVLDHRQEIMGVWQDPDASRDFWAAADKPYMFLAVCEELGEVLAFNPITVTIVTKEAFDFFAEGFKSHLGGAQDGSCNGIQHFSAMLLDPVGAMAVNMTNSTKVEDIYQQTADLVIEGLDAILETGVVMNGLTAEGATPEQLRIVDGLLNHLRVTRKATKRSTMIVPYGGTKRSCLAYVKEWVIETNDKYHNEAGGKLFDDKEVYAAALLLHHYVWHALDTVVIAARKAMKFLRDLIKVNNRLGVAMEWTTPTGFIARQEIKATKLVEVSTFLFGRMSMKYQADIDELNKKKMSSSFAPNFVHSMDASHLMLTVNKALDLGIENFALVHDSYAVPFGQCDAFHRVIRETFVDIYEHNVLVNLREQQIQQFPDLAGAYPSVTDVERGDYDIHEVKEARYFFR